MKVLSIIMAVVSSSIKRQMNHQKKQANFYECVREKNHTSNKSGVVKRDIEKSQDEL